jgi:hypothetical protein
MTKPITDDQLESLRHAYAYLRPSERWANPFTIPALIARVDELKAETRSLRSTIVDLEAERDAAKKRADEWYAHARRAVAEGDELRAQVTADTPKEPEVLQPDAEVDWQAEMKRRARHSVSYADTSKCRECGEVWPCAGRTAASEASIPEKNS